MWWERFDGIDLYGGRITFVLDGGEDMLAVKFTDGMTVDVGSPDEGGTYCVTAVSSDDVEGWNKPLCELGSVSADELCGAVQAVIERMRGGKHDKVDKNALISEMLYMLFVRLKGLGAKYKYPELDRILLLSIELTKLLYKDGFDDADRAVLTDGFIWISRYLPCAFTCYRADDLVFEPFLTPEPANRMLVIQHEILRIADRSSRRNDAALLIHALHNLPRAYMTKRAEYLTESNHAVHPEEALSYCGADMKLFKHALGSERIAYSSADISSVDERGVTFADGVLISFAECAENRRLQYPDSVSVAVRDITADPPYYDFFTSFMPTRVAFDKTGFSAKKHNGRDFHDLYEKINKAGYKTYDLS